LPLVITPPQLPYGGGTRRVVLPQTFDCGNYVGELANGDLFYYTVDCDRWTPEAGIKWQITDEHMGYFRYAQGWKSGGLRQEALTEQTNNSKRFVEPYLPETVNSFEVGVRTQWLDNQLFLNGTYFYNDYDNMQVTSLEPNDVGLVTALINNAESAVTQGFELEGAYRPDWAEKIPLTASTIGLTFGVGLTDAHYNKFVGTTVPNPTDTTGCDNLARGDCSDLIVDTFAVNTVIFPVLGPLGFVDYPETVSVDLSGNQFKNTPRWNANASLTYAFDPMSEATLSFRLDWSYRSTVYYTTVNSDLLKSDPLNLLNGAVTLDVHSTQSQIVFWVKNLTDEVYLNGALDLGEALGANGLYYSQGRTFGIRFLQSF
jgi:iron complex outermembrane receptor protein